MATALCGWNGAARAAAANGAASGAEASATTVDFDRNLLSGSGQNTTDLSRFERGNLVLPGNYNVDIYLNNAWVGRTDVRFVARTPQVSATACVDQHMLTMMQLHPQKISDAAMARLKDASACVDIGELIPGATMSFDQSNLRLDTSVPQAFLSQAARGYVSPEFWDRGVNAGLLNYNFNTYHSDSAGQAQTTSYLGLNLGANFGAWLLRENATVTWTSASAQGPARRDWQNIESYVQRDLPSWHALLTLGDSYTDGEVFDSYEVRGVQLGTDDRMLPQSLQGYAPVVHGVAQTNARVTVRQNGILIYETTVSPGPFTINDLYPTGYGGNLDVTVMEATGQTSTFVVPYASVAQLLRPGITRFDIVAGQLIDTSISNKPAVVQATAQHGFNNLLTGYAGVVASNGYAAVLAGAAINTKFGALALDLTHSQAQIPDDGTHAGQSLRITYSKIIPDTQTTLSVAAYRYSTAGYLSLTDAAEARDYAEHGADAFQYTLPSALSPNATNTGMQAAEQASLGDDAFNTDPVLRASGLELQRNSFTLTVNQRLGQHGGALYADGSISDYWNERGTNTQFQIGYSNTFRRLSYSVSAIRSVEPTGRYDNEYLLSFSLPLGRSSHSPSFTLNLAHDQATGAQDQAMVTGALGADNQFSYSASGTHTGDGGGNAGALNGSYRSPFAVFSANYGNGSGYSQASAGVSGSVIAHAGGVTFGQPVGDTVAIVYVPGATGARIGNSSGARVNSDGYAIVPNLIPYSLNSIQLDPKGLPLNVQLDATSAQVAPYAGAVVMVKFKTENGRMVIIRTHLKNGAALPFGAEVYDEHGTELGVVGQGGQVLARGVNQAGVLVAHWSDDNGQDMSCKMNYELTGRGHDTKSVGAQETDAMCVPVAATEKKG